MQAPRIFTLPVAGWAGSLLGRHMQVLVQVKIVSGENCCTGAGLSRFES